MLKVHKFFVWFVCYYGIIRLLFSKFTHLVKSYRLISNPIFVNNHWDSHYELNKMYMAVYEIHLVICTISLFHILDFSDTWFGSWRPVCRKTSYTFDFNIWKETNCLNILIVNLEGETTWANACAVYKRLSMIFFIFYHIRIFFKKCSAFQSSATKKLMHV